MPVVWELIIGHILFIGGSYLFARGILLALGSTAAAREVFITKPFFWGLIAILGGFCLIFARHLSGA